jgi:pectinesterase
MLLAASLLARTAPVSAATNYDAIVAADGSGTYTNIQSAIAAAPTNGAKPFVILIRPGTYQGQVIVPKTKRRLQFVGEETAKTIITYDLNQNEPAPRVPVNLRGNGVVIQADDFSAEKITFQNASGDHGQAQALHTLGDREVFNDCRILGWQDTLRTDNGRNYFTNCYIEGRVDFIYGSATAVFDHCEIRSKNGGHVTAANTPQNQPYGLVFMNCTLTGDPKPWVSPEGIPANTNQPPKADLGRPWRPYGSVTYLNCEMGAHIKSEGWNNWGNRTNELTARFAEYNSRGPGANVDKRFKWATQLTKEEAEKITVQSVLGGGDAWNPLMPP